jgi:hypothetical protein
MEKNLNSSIHQRKIAYLVSSELSKKLRVVGKRLDLKTSTIDIDSQQLGSIGAKGDLFDFVRVDHAEEVRVSNISRLTVRILLDGSDISLGLRGGRHVKSHTKRRTSRLGEAKRCARGEGTCLVYKEEGHNGGSGKLHC